MTNERHYARLLGVLIALCGPGCGRDTGPQTTPLSSGAPSSPPPPPVRSSCAELVQRFDDELARAPGTCATDADCRCYAGGISKNHGCGGITDVATEARLAAIAKEHATAACRSGIQCAAWSCQPICKAGRCDNAPRP